MSYSSEVAADSPLGYWRLADTSGTTAVDSSGSSRDGTFSGTYTLAVTGLLASDTDNTAASFSTGRVQVATAAWMDTDHATLEAIVKPTTVSSSRWIAGRDHDGGTTELAYRLDISGGKYRAICQLDGSSTLHVVTSTTSPAVGTTHHVALTYDGSTLKLYVNGVSEGTPVSVSGILKKTGRAINMARSGINGLSYGGTLDEVAVYGTALSSTRLLAHYNAIAAITSGTVTLAGTLATKTASFAVATVLAATMAGTLQAKTAAFTADTELDATFAGTMQSKTAAFTVDAAASVSDVALAGELQPKSAAFGLLGGADVSLAGSLQPKTAEFAILGGASVALVGTLRAKTAALSLTGINSITVAGSLRAKTAAFTLESGRTVSLAGSLRRKTSAITIASNPAVRIAATMRAKTAAFAIDAQPTATLAGTLQPKLATFTTYVVTPVTPSPVVGAQSVVVGRAFGPITMQGSQAVYSISSAYTPRARQRILVDNVDWSFFRGAITPDVSFTLLEPLLYGPATLDLPQVSACFERPGYGDLAPLRPGALVEVQRVLDDVVVGTDYKGVVVAFDTSGRNLSVELGGEASGRAALRNRQVPIFPRVNDLGRQFADSITDLGLPFYPHFGPVTGIEAMTTGGVGHLEHIQGIVAKAWTRAGKHWTIMPDESTGAYEAHRKDDTTIHGTVFIDDAKTVANLRRDISEEPNRIYLTGVLANGQRVRFGVYPGLFQGPVPAFMGPIEEGDTGDAVRLLVGKLHASGYLKLVETEGGFDADVREAVIRLQNDAGLFDDGFTTPAVPGVVGIRTWEALYDLGITGNSLEWAHIEPAAQRRKVRPWNRSAQGGIMGVNPGHDPNHLVRDRNIDAGGGWENRSQLSEFAWAVLHDSDSANWVGDITFHAGALIRGDGFEGMTVTEADVMDARELRPGMNIDLPQFDGGTLFHIAAIQVDDSGIVTATVDTRFRDAMEVWEVIARNKESRNDPSRQRNQKHRSSTITKDWEWDEFAGYLGQDIDLKVGWNEFQVVATLSGTVRQLKIVLETPAEFAVMVFGGQVTAEWLNVQIPRPLTNFGTKQLETKRDELDDRGLLFAAGTKDEPCGYWPNRKVETEYDAETDDEIDTVTNAPTGKHVDDSGFAYRSANRTELTVVVWVAEENKIPLQRIMWNQLESGA